MSDTEPAIVSVPADQLQPGQVVTAAGILRTVAGVTVDSGMVVIEWTPPQDPDTWEYLTDVDENGDPFQLQQPPTEAAAATEFQVLA